MKSMKKLREEDKMDDEILKKEVTNFDELNAKLKVMQEGSKRSRIVISFLLMIFVIISCVCCTLMEEVKDLKDWKAQVEENTDAEAISSKIND